MEDGPHIGRGGAQQHQLCVAIIMHSLDHPNDDLAWWGHTLRTNVPFVALTEEAFGKTPSHGTYG